MAGRGIKGQKSRSGVALGGYEGGQMPLYRRLPKRGFTAPNAKSFAVVNLGQIQGFIDAGKIDGKAELTEDALVASGLVRRKLDGIRVLAKGELTGRSLTSSSPAHPRPPSRPSRRPAARLRCPLRPRLLNKLLIGAFRAP